MILYKYLPSKFLPAFLDRGEMLFRNLCFFRKVEGDTARGDNYEGMHLDAPNHPVTIENLSTGAVVEVDAAAVRKVDFQSIFVFCVSKTLSTELMKAFGADTCIRILDSDRFAQRCARSIRKIVHLDPKGLIAGPVQYYDQSQDVECDITDPGQVSFLKTKKFSMQDEYRFVFGIKNSLSPRQNQMHLILKHALDAELKADIEECLPRQRTIRIGRIRDFCEVVTASDL